MDNTDRYIDNVIHQVHHTLGVNGSSHPGPVNKGPEGSVGVLSPVLSSADKIKNLAFEILSKLGKLWETVGKKGVKISKIILESFSLAAANDERVEKIEFAISCLGLASLIEFCFEVRDAVKDIKQLKKECKFRDPEGIAWSSFDIIMDFCGITKTLLSCGKTLNEFVKIPFITLFSIVTFPLTLLLLTYETTRTLYKLIVSSIEFSELPNTVEGEQGFATFKDYLNKKVGITEKERKKIIEAVNESYGIITISDTKTGTDFSLSLTVIKANSLSKNINFLTRRSSVDKESEIDKEILRQCEILKSAKINRLSRKVDKRIVEYMARTRVNLRFIEFYNLLNITSGEAELEEFFTHLTEREKQLGTSPKANKERQAIKTIRDYFDYIEKAPKGIDHLGSQDDKKLKVIQENFNKQLKEVDNLLETYLLVQGKPRKAIQAAEMKPEVVTGDAAQNAVPIVEIKPTEVSKPQQVLPHAHTVAEKGLKDLKKLSIRKIVLHSINVLTCLVEWTMYLISILLTPLAASITKLAFSGCKAGLSVFKEVYEFHLMDKGLNIPEFFPRKKVL